MIDSEDSKGELKLHGCNDSGIGSPGYSDAYTKNIYINGGNISNELIGETASAPSAAAKYGDVVYTYSNSKQVLYLGKDRH